MTKKIGKTLAVFLPFLFVAIVVIMVYASDLTGKYDWLGRPWVRLQAAEVIVESTLVVQDTTKCDFYQPDDSSTAHLAGWADSSNFALNADSLGGTIVPDDVLLSTRIDSTSYNFYHIGQTFLQGHVTLSQDKYFYLKNSSTSTLEYDGTDTRVEWNSANDVELWIRAETLLIQSIGEVGPAVVFSDSSGDEIMAIYNDGGFSILKDYAGVGTWANGATVDTIELIGLDGASLVLVTPRVTGFTVHGWCITDTAFVGRDVDVGDDTYNYLIVRGTP